MSIEIFHEKVINPLDMLNTPEERMGFTLARLSELVPSSWAERFWIMFNKPDSKRFANSNTREDLADSPSLESLHRQIFLILRQKGYPAFLAYYDKKIKCSGREEQWIFSDAVWGCGRFLLEPREDAPLTSNTTTTQKNEQ